MEGVQKGTKVVRWENKLNGPRLLAHRLRRDAATELRAVEVDLLDGGVGGGWRALRIVVQCRLGAANKTRPNL